MAETPESGGPTPDDTSSASTAPPEPQPTEPEPESSDSGDEAGAPVAPEVRAEAEAPVEADACQEPEAPEEPDAHVEAEPSEEPEPHVEPEAPEEPAPLDIPDSFEAFVLSDALRRAVAAMGWDKPMPVQAATFAPLMQGRDVMVQSHTGSGKTGAFCIPWLASRFEPGPAAETGVQLLVVLPTRELAKQVCDQLLRLSTEIPVRTLPIYGGTAMQPQLTALANGVHAVVGTPGRLLDHLRRRSLKLARVRTVVLDECDEMLSMGFLEDIRALLEACPSERQTCLFSATVPSDIERIARRYMRDPELIKLSGDHVAAAEIQHAYYSVAGTLKTRDLLDVIVLEEPTTALVFCNTREETNLVASVLKREGYAAEPLSSDLTQPQREHVMAKMREGQIRFLVATDVAARGIDITHISHVINYSFPEAADVYVHRTGRTARAGRHGIALSLVAPHEIGSFYSLKLHHPSIEFEERSLPPPEELARQRAETQLDHISQLFPNLVSPEWTLLARNLAADPRGERVVAQLLEQAMTKVIRERRPEESRRPREREREPEDRRPRRGRAGGRREDHPRDRLADRRGRRSRRAPSEAPAESSEPPTEATKTPRETSEAEPAEAPAATDRSAEGPGERAEGTATTEPSERSGRRRRRRRRRKPRSADAATVPAEAEASDGDAEAPGPEAAPAQAPGEPPAEAAPSPGDAAAEEGMKAEAEGTPTVEKHAAEDEAAGEGGARRRKRRRRRRRAEPPQAVPAMPHVPQDQIIIDIDPSELDVVREEFGEIDELDDLTLKARRRAVIDVLQDEMELEDVSERDADHEDAENGEDGGEEEDDDIAPAVAAESAAASEDGEPVDADGATTTTPEPERQAEAPKRKRRRRRRKKKKKEEVPIPELTAPPHKDFWEVWAEKFSFRDFEDAAYGSAAAVEEPEEPPELEQWEAGAQEDEGSFVPVVLNVGRMHGKKAAQIRDLLRTHVGLAGKAIRDLTVHDANTVFRIHPQRVEGVAKVLGRCQEAGVALELSRYEEPTTATGEQEPAPEVEDESEDEPYAVPAEAREGSAVPESDTATQADERADAAAVPADTGAAPSPDLDPDSPPPEASAPVD